MKSSVNPAEKLLSLPSAASGKTYSIFIRDLVLECKIGVYSHEKEKTQPVRLNLSLECIEHPAINDDYANAICYAELVADIESLMAQGHIQLIETLAERIADRALSDSRVLSVIVRAEKLNAIPKAAGVGVEIERRRHSSPIVRKAID